ncbi:YdeI family protein [uncultured Maribacter sp.]|uniref:YdeI/OmpD-associated family protein n=1 Tax=uncultured Maribacter sp. TaxID=431308 RepID=UPI00262C1760|nr:YdeI/OmpD-associated family protein [uncultured Maribacter sp.]
MSEKLVLYFKNDTEWRTWLQVNYTRTEGVYLIFYKVDHAMESMRWEEAVKVALCYGWIDSTVKSLGNGKRQQYFSPRKQKSVWSKLNKTYIKLLIKNELMHDSGLVKIKQAKKDGSWNVLDNVENGIIPKDLRIAFNQNEIAFKNYTAFSKSYRKNYLYWLHQAKRETTRLKRISEIINLCENNIKSRENR